MLRFALCLLIAAPPAAATTCDVSFDFSFDAQLGALAPGAPLSAQARFKTVEPLRQPGDGLSFTTEGELTMTAPDGTQLTARIVDMHISRTDGSLDYISFNARRLSGDLGGLTEFADPMLVTWYGPHGTLPGLDFPESDEWEELTKRRAVQMRIPGTPNFFFGKIGTTRVNCSENGLGVPCPVNAWRVLL